VPLLRGVTSGAQPHDDAPDRAVERDRAKASLV